MHEIEHDSTNDLIPEKLVRAGYGRELTHCFPNFGSRFLWSETEYGMVPSYNVRKALFPNEVILDSDSLLCLGKYDYIGWWTTYSVRHNARLKPGHPYQDNYQYRAMFTNPEDAIVCKLKFG